MYFPPKDSVKVEFLLAQLLSKEVGGLKSAFKSVEEIGFSHLNKNISCSDFFPFLLISGKLYLAAFDLFGIGKC